MNANTMTRSQLETKCRSLAASAMDISHGIGTDLVDLADALESNELSIDEARQQYAELVVALDEAKAED